jgi:hypothetical protein
MDALHIQAMFVRHEAAIRLRKENELDPWEALRMVVMPTEETLRASLSVAETTGPSGTALHLARRGTTRRRRPQLPKRMRDRQPALG